jgi:hypothetical protein
MIRVLSLYDSSPNVSSSAIASSNACTLSMIAIVRTLLPKVILSKAPSPCQAIVAILQNLVGQMKHKIKKHRIKLVTKMKNCIFLSKEERGKKGS